MQLAMNIKRLDNDLKKFKKIRHSNIYLKLFFYVSKKLNGGINNDKKK
jgi:hypothetical protein